jgi:hypothetical protein
MRKLVVLLTLTAFLMPAVAGAQDGDVKTKFYNFDDLLIDGEFKKPDVTMLDARQKVKFERLLQLKKDFLPSLKATAKDATLR